MRPLSLVVALAALVTLATPSPAAASTITSFTVANGHSTSAPGQSLTTPTGGPWNNLTFNWFERELEITFPVASGDLYLLTQEYLGTPAGLSAATPGFLARTSNISGGMWLFDPSVTIQGATQYFFYSTLGLSHLFFIHDGYPGGTRYSLFGGVFVLEQPPNFPDFRDSDFALAGTLVTAAVPEPTSLLLLGTGLAAVMAVRRRRSAARH